MVSNKRKRGNGEGGIGRRKNGGWYAQYYVPAADGGRRRRTISGKTRVEVAKKLAKAIADLDDGLVYDAGTLTVGEYLDRWLRDSVRDTVKDSTFASYRQLVGTHVKPALGRVKLEKLSSTHVRGLLRQNLDAGLSPRTVQYVRFVLRRALDGAVADRLIPRNPAADARAPQVRREEMKPLSPAQARVFLEAARDDRLHALYVLAVHCGLRQGELLGLRWEDVDAEAGTLGVQRTLVGTEDGTPVFGSPKTRRSRRRIRLTSGAARALTRHRKRQLEERMALAGSWRDQGLVFATAIGTPLSRHNLVRRSFKLLLKRCGLPEVRFHDLRHTCATLLLSRGQHPKLVQELLGHSTIAITLDTYSHVLPGMGDGLADAMDDALG